MSSAQREKKKQDQQKTKIFYGTRPALHSWFFILSELQIFWKVPGYIRFQSKRADSVSVIGVMVLKKYSRECITYT